MLISESVHDRLAQHLRDETTDHAASDLHVPILYFVSPDRAAREIALFRTLPMIAARSSELPEPLTFITRDLLGEPLLITRQKNGEIKAFLNICRHRGGRVEFASSGRKRVFTCRYHGWSYQQSGALRSIPYAEAYDSLGARCNDLVSVTSEERHGFIWVTLSGPPQQVTDYLGPEIEERLTTLSLATAVTYKEIEFSQPINWKLIVDGALDIMHAPFLHIGGVDDYVTSHAGVWSDFGLHGQLFTVRKKRAERLKAGDRLELNLKNFTTSLAIFPNALCFSTPDHVEFWTVWPSPDGTTAHVRIRLLAQPEILNDRMKARLDRSWAILEKAALEEDWPMAATIQANAAVDPTGSFLYGRGEVSCQHLHRELNRLLAEAPVEAPPADHSSVAAA